MSAPPDVSSSLETRYAGTLRAIDQAVEAAGRVAGSVRLLAVSKRKSAAQVRALAALGQRDFGENQVQEARRKQRDLAGLALNWHFIGPLQSNKTRAVAEHFDWVHSVDRPKLIHRLEAQRPAEFAPLSVCVQLKVGDESSKSGAAPDEVRGLAHALAGCKRLRLRGLMAIPPPETDEHRQRQHFHQVRVLFDTLRGEGVSMDTLSMGMSNDWPVAVLEGATIIRLGTALFGPR